MKRNEMIYILLFVIKVCCLFISVVVRQMGVCMCVSVRKSKQKRNKCTQSSTRNGCNELVARLIWLKSHTFPLTVSIFANFDVMPFVCASIKHNRKQFSLYAHCKIEQFGWVFFFYRRAVVFPLSSEFLCVFSSSSSSIFFFSSYFFSFILVWFDWI